MKKMLLVIALVFGLASTMALVGCESGGSGSDENWDAYAGTWSGTGNVPSPRTITVTVSAVDGGVSLRDTAGNTAAWPWSGDTFFGPTEQFNGNLEFESGSEGVVSYAGGDVAIQKQ